MPSNESVCVYAFFASFAPGHYMETWRHPQDRKYITYRNAARGGLSYGHKMCRAQKILWSFDILDTLIEILPCRGRSNTDSVVTPDLVIAADCTRMFYACGYCTIRAQHTNITLAAETGEKMQGCRRWKQECSRRVWNSWRRFAVVKFMQTRRYSTHYTRRSRWRMSVELSPLLLLRTCCFPWLRQNI